MYNLLSKDKGSVMKERARLDSALGHCELTVIKHSHQSHQASLKGHLIRIREGEAFQGRCNIPAVET